MAAEDSTNIRFTEEMALAAAQIAARQGKSRGQWIREIVNREIAIANGDCPACGQPRSREGGKAPPAPV